MVTKPSLNGFKVLITRPEKQAQKLCDMVTEIGGEAIALPVIDIVPIAANQWDNVTLPEQDMIICVSRNAVRYFMAGIQQDLPDNVQLVAIGSGTAAFMRDNGLRVDIQPPSPAGSESLLATPDLNNVTDKKVLIVRGEGGRELLAETLTARGAKISYIEVYQRNLPIVSMAKIEQAKMADCVIVTSVAGLDNLCRLMTNGILNKKWLIVVSERIRKHAISLGFQHISVADDASDIAIMQQVIKVEQNNGKR